MLGSWLRPHREIYVFGVNPDQDFTDEDHSLTLEFTDSDGQKQTYDILSSLVFRITNVQEKRDSWENTSIYLKHELLHALGFSKQWPKWNDFYEHGCINDPDLTEFIKNDPTLEESENKCAKFTNGSHVDLRPQLHKRDQRMGIHLIAKFEWFVLQAIGWRLRETTSFEPLAFPQKPLTNGKPGEAYEDSLLAFGGVPTYQFWITDGKLPQGLSLDSFTGKIHEKPLEAGFFQFKVTLKYPGIKKEPISRAFEINIVN